MCLHTETCSPQCSQIHGASWTGRLWRGEPRQSPYGCGKWKRVQWGGCGISSGMSKRTNVGSTGNKKDLRVLCTSSYSPSRTAGSATKRAALPEGTEPAGNRAPWGCRAARWAAGCFFYWKTHNNNRNPFRSHRLWGFQPQAVPNLLHPQSLSRGEGLLQEGSCRSWLVRLRWALRSVSRKCRKVQMLGSRATATPLLKKGNAWSQDIIYHFLEQTVPFSLFHSLLQSASNYSPPCVPTGPH